MKCRITKARRQIFAFAIGIWWEWGDVDTEFRGKLMGGDPFAR